MYLYLLQSIPSSADTINYKNITQLQFYLYYKSSQVAGVDPEV